jgi:hypothetical protein
MCVCVSLFLYMWIRLCVIIYAAYGDHFRSIVGVWLYIMKFEDMQHSIWRDHLGGYGFKILTHFVRTKYLAKSV